tara:strand:- start:285 stop:770 length:486 start_codon:yes stop_codon:yes gene_type:complete
MALYSAGTSVLNAGALVGAGKINQVLSVEHGTYASSTSASWAATGLTLSLTPTATSSKILVILNSRAMKASGNTGVQLQLTGNIGGAGSATLRQFTKEAGQTSDTARNDFGGAVHQYLWSPSSTSACVAAVEYARYGSSGEVRVHSSSDEYSSMVMMEVLA